MKSHLEEILSFQIRAYGLIPPEREYRFHSQRKFRFDFAWPVHRVAAEVEGGVWMRRGAHAGGTAILRDMEKHNLATLHGWSVFRFGDRQIKDGSAVIWLAKILSRHK